MQFDIALTFIIVAYATEVHLIIVQEVFFLNKSPKLNCYYIYKIILMTEQLSCLCDFLLRMRHGFLAPVF